MADRGGRSRSDSYRRDPYNSRDSYQSHDSYRNHKSHHSHSRVSYHDHDSQSGDSWEAKNDRHHYERVELAKKRRALVASDCSRSTTPMGPPPKPMGPPQHYSSSVSRERNETVESRKDSALNDDRSCISSSISVDTTDEPPYSAKFSDSFQDELDNYEIQSRTLREDEWVGPPNPRARSRRVDAKELTKEGVVALRKFSFVSGFMYGSSTSALRVTDLKRSRETYKLGTVFSAPFHTASSSDALYVSCEDPNLTATPFGIICSKYRKLIVVRLFGEHCTVVPIYTHNGQGLEGKVHLGEFVSIRDKRSIHPAKQEGPYQKLEAEKDSEYDGKFIAGRSCVKLTETCSHRYDVPATIEGKLDKLSFKRLQELLKVVVNASS